MDYQSMFQNLNKEQKSAVLLIENPVRIVAGPGSGKTRVLTTKIAYLIDSIGIKPYRILALTFTNKAANEMKERLKSLIGEEKSNKTFISTFHSFCYYFLREEIHLLEKFNNNFNILDGIDQDNILKEIYKKYEISKSDISYYFAKNFISYNKNNNISPEELNKDINDFSDPLEINKAKIYSEYQKLLINSNSLDYDDLLIYTKQILDKFPEIKDKWSKRFDYFLIDEFQDTSKIQYEIINSIAINNNITIVGDPDQTIYSWRGADISFINNFDSLYKNSSTVTLIQNYRSTKNILKIANNLIKFNSNRLVKNLITENELGDKVQYYKAYSTENEARWVYNQITKLKNNNYQLKDIVVLYRSNYYSRSIEDLLATKAIPYKMLGGQKFYEREEIKNCLAFLRCIYKPTDISLKRIINVPSRKLGDETLKKLINFAENKNISLWDSWEKYLEFIDISNDKKSSLFNFINQLKKYQLLIENKTEKIGDILLKFLNEIGYISMLENYKDNLSISKIENIKELISSINKWEDENINSSIEDYLNSISLEQVENKNSISNSLTLMTIHAAKGLEYKVVFVIGLNEGVFPSSKVIQLDDENGESFGIEEERRLAYVAFTRAQEKLFISSASDPYSEYKKFYSNKPSRFIYESGLDLNGVTYNEENFKLSLEDHMRSNPNDFEIGEKIIHSVFGKGIVLDIKGDSIIIEFEEKKFGIKQLLKNHKSLEKAT